MKPAWHIANIAVYIFVAIRVVGVLCGFFDYIDRVEEFLLKFLMGAAFVNEILKMIMERLEELTK